MTRDPFWAPQNQPMSATGISPTNIGRDQNTYNTYTALSADGVHLSYNSFKHAIETEVASIRQEAGQQILRTEDHYRQLLASAFSDYKNASSARELAEVQLKQAQERLKGRRLRDRRLGDRSAWASLAVFSVLCIVGGAWAGSSWFGGVTPSLATAATTMDPQPLSWAHEPLECGSDRHIVRLEAVRPGPDRDWTTDVLVKEYRNRLRNVRIDAQIHVTVGEGSCDTAGAADSQESAFIWAGPYGDRADAERACRGFRSAAVSEDCYATRG